MKIRILLTATFLALWMLSRFLGAEAVAEDLHIVPRPAEYSFEEGDSLKLPAIIKAAANDAKWNRHLEIFGAYLSRLTQGRHRLGDAGEPALSIQHDTQISDEAYSLEIAESQILITAGSLKGLTHATATLLQLVGENPDGVLPRIKINDAPKLSYRNFMIDMGRNPHSFELLQETIDLLWFYKIGSLHLHLTDDQRFAFPSSAYPKLWDRKISLKQFKELESYAVDRGVTLIPELEVPGHSALLRKHYPEVFGRTPTELAKNETAIEGIKTLLDEMIDVFSSTPYIHIGGDEAFGVPEELQRNLINKLHDYLKSKGRQTVVWEGPSPGAGDNKVHTDVIHLNWRTINYPATEMLNDGYRVVNAAWDPLYIVDHYPRTNFTLTAPQHIYKTLKLTRFKHVNPGIPTFGKPVDVKPNDRLIGFCMPWWEGREKNFMQINVPRLISMAEVAWNPDINRDYDSFSRRAAKTEAARRAAFHPVAISASDLAVPQDGVFHDRTTIELTENSGNQSQIRYTIDGSVPDPDSPLYAAPFEISKDTIVRAGVFVDGKIVGHGSRRKFTAVVLDEKVAERNLAFGKPVQSSVPSASPFSAARITDGGIGNLNFYLGYPAAPEPISITIDLQKTQQLNRIVVFAYTINGSFEKYSVELSKDGKLFTEVGSRLEKPEKPTPKVEHKFDAQDARYVRVRTHGNRGYVFDSFSKIIEIQAFKD